MKEFYLEVAAIGGLVFRTGISLRNSLLGLPVGKENLVVLQATHSQLVHILEKLEVPILLNGHTELVTENLQIKILLNIQELSELSDFSIHNIFINPLTDSIFDPFHGALDLKNKFIRANKKIFQGNPIKMVEACRLTEELGFTLNVETWFEIYDNARVAKHINPELLREELSTILQLPTPSPVFKLLQQTRLLQNILPELADCEPVIQSKRSGVKNVFEHVMYALDACDNRLDLRLTILFHDIAKPRTLQYNPDGSIHFFKHEVYGAKIARSYLKYWNFPKDIVHRVPHLILHHMFDADPKMVDKTVKRLIRKVGQEHIYDLLKVREADRGGTSEKISMKKIKLLRKKIERILSDKSDHTLGSSSDRISIPTEGSVPSKDKIRSGITDEGPTVPNTTESKEIVGDTARADNGTDGAFFGELPVQP